MINNIIRSATRNSKRDKVRCLTFCRENEGFFNLLSNCNCEIYVVPRKGVSDWKPSICKIPENIFPLKDESLIATLPYVDCVIINDRLQEWDMGMSISQSLHIPTIVIDHVTRDCLQKLPLGSEVNVEAPLENRNGNINVSLSEKAKESWGASVHGVSVTIPPYLQGVVGDESKDLIVVDNNLPQQPMGMIEQFVSEFDAVPRFPQDNSKDLRKAKVYINTWNNIDIKTIEAMSFGSIAISPRTKETSKFIEHKKNGLLFSDLSEIPQMIRDCLSGKYENIPEEGIKSALEMSCDKESFIKKWNQVLSYISESFFLRN